MGEHTARLIVLLIPFALLAPEATHTAATAAASGSKFGSSTGYLPNWPPGDYMNLLADVHAETACAAACAAQDGAAVFVHNAVAGECALGTGADQLGVVDTDPGGGAIMINVATLVSS